MVNSRYTDPLVRYRTHTRWHSRRSVFGRLAGTHSFPPLRAADTADPFLLNRVGCIFECAEPVNWPSMPGIRWGDRSFLLIEDDLSEQGEEALAQLMSSEVSAPFDLQAGPLIRGRLIRLSRDEHVLMITMHQNI